MAKDKREHVCRVCGVRGGDWCGHGRNRLVTLAFRTEPVVMELTRDWRELLRLVLTTEAQAYIHRGCGCTWDSRGERGNVGDCQVDAMLKRLDEAVSTEGGAPTVGGEARPSGEQEFVESALLERIAFWERSRADKAEAALAAAQADKDVISEACEDALRRLAAAEARVQRLIATMQEHDCAHCQEALRGASQ